MAQRHKGLVLSSAASFVLGAAVGMVLRPRARPPEVAAAVAPPLPKRRPVARIAALCAAAAIVIVASYGVNALMVRRDQQDWAIGATNGDPRRAPLLLKQKGCAGCHTISGVSVARGTVGPALAGLSDRGYIGGRLPNTPENLVMWIGHSREIDPGSAMPTIGLSDQEARDIAAYLYAH